MSRLRCLGAVCLAFTLGLAGTYAMAQDKKDDTKKRTKQPGGAGGFQFGRGGQGPLVSDALQEKLNLSAEQKSTVTKLNGEFKDKSKDITDKLAELRKKGLQDKDARAEMLEQSKALQAMRTDFQKKVTAALNEDQKKIYEDSKARAGFGQFGGFGRALPGQFLPPALQTQLKLTQEQKDKLAQMQKDYESKALGVLTDEQKKQLEELKKNPVRPGGQPRPKTNGALSNLNQIPAATIVDALKRLRNKQ